MSLPSGIATPHDLLDKLRRGDDTKGAFPALPSEAGTFQSPDLGYGLTWGEEDPTSDSVENPEGGPDGFLGSMVNVRHEFMCGKTRGDCDDGSMIVTDVVNQPDADDHRFMLTTNNDDGDYNSATGNREIGIKKTGSDIILFTRGAHRTTTQAIKDVDYTEHDAASGAQGSGRRLQRKRIKAKRRSLLEGVTAPAHDTRAKTATATKKRRRAQATSNDRQASDQPPAVMTEGSEDFIDVKDGAEEEEEQKEIETEEFGEQEEEKAGGRKNDWVAGEPHLGGRFLEHVEITPGNFSHYSNESHPRHGRRVLKYDATVHNHVVSLDLARHVIANVHCMSDGATKGRIDIALRPGILDVGETPLQALQKASIVVGHASWVCNLEGNGGRSRPILRRVVSKPYIRSIVAADGRTQHVVLSLETVPAKFTDAFLKLDVHLEITPPATENIATRRRRRAQMSEHEREHARKLLEFHCPEKDIDTTSFTAGITCEWGPGINLNYKECTKVEGIPTKNCAAKANIKFAKLGQTYFGVCANCYFNAEVKIVWKMKIDALKPWTGAEGENGVLLKMYVAR